MDTKSGKVKSQNAKLKTMFHKARITLTIWYLIIIMAISVFFSSFIYVGATGEFSRILRMQEYRREHPEVRLRLMQDVPWQYQKPPAEPDPKVIEDAEVRVLESLIGINLIIFILSAISGYFLAGRTLRPIKKMIEEQNRFVSDSSHELRTPLTSLRSEIEVALRNKTLSLKTSKKTLQSNLEEVISLQILSDNLLELSQDGKLVNKNLMEDLSIAKIIDEAIKKTMSLARAKQIEIENKVKDLKIKGVSDRLIEVFIIFLDNAIKYSPKGSRVEIFSKTESNEVKIFVKDYGIGIWEQDLPYVFDRFYRAERSRTKRGYGLGLSIAKKIIESHGGSVTAESKDGKGSVFTVILSKV